MAQSDLLVTVLRDNCPAQGLTFQITHRAKVGPKIPDRKLIYFT